MKKNVLNTDLTGKVAVVTGGGGILCSCFAEAIAMTGASVAVLDLNEDAAKEVAEKVQQNIKDKIQTMTGNAVTRVNVSIADIEIENNEEKEEQ